MTPKAFLSSSAAELAAVKIPEETKTYKPVTHSELIHLATSSIVTNGFEIEQSRYRKAREGKIANALYKIKSTQDPEIGLMIAWQNSYDKSLKVGFAIGANVFLCDNGMIRGDMGTFRKKHTGEIQTFVPEEVKDYISSANEVLNKLIEEKNLMKKTPISEVAAASLLGQMFVKEELVNATQMIEIKRQIQKPDYDYGADGSLWQFYNHITVALKQEHPSTYISKHIDVHKFIMDHVN